MYSRKYQIKIGEDSVDAKWERRSHSMPVRIVGSIAMTAGAAAWIYFVAFVPHGGYSAWYALTHEGAGSRYFIEAAISSALNLCIAVVVLAFGVRSLFPSGEKLHCDRSQLIVSRMPWMNLRGQ